MSVKKTIKQQRIDNFVSSSARQNKPGTSVTPKVDREMAHYQDDLERLSDLESQLCGMKRRFEKKKKAKKGSVKKRKTLDLEIEALLELCQEKLNKTPLKDQKNKSTTSKKKNKKEKNIELDLDKPYLPVSACNIMEGGKQMENIIFTPIRITHSNWEKQENPSKCSQSAAYSLRQEHGSPRAMVPSQNKEQTRKNLPKAIRFDQTQSMIKKEGEHSDGATTVTTKKQVSPSLYPLKNQSAVKSIGSPPGEGNASNYCSLPGGPAHGLQARPSDKVYNEVYSMPENTAGSSGYSQDLFITQKTFLPIDVMSSSTGGSSSQGQNPSTLKNYSCTEVMPLFSQVSAFTVKDADPSTENSVMVTDKATQTDDIFSYLALMPLITKVQVMEECPDRPLDLSLPTRIRAANENTLWCIKSDDDIILWDIKPAQTSLPAVPGRDNLCFSQLRRLEEGKFVQTLLNSSYFFKGKGEPDDSIRITPLVKQKEVKTYKRKTVGLRN